MNVSSQLTRLAVRREKVRQTDTAPPLTCDIQLNSEMAGGRVLEIHTAAVDALVGQGCPVDNQVTFAGDLAVKRESKIGAQSK